MHWLVACSTACTWSLQHMSSIRYWWVFSRHLFMSSTSHVCGYWRKLHLYMWQWIHWRWANLWWYAFLCRSLSIPLLCQQCPYMVGYWHTWGIPCQTTCIVTSLHHYDNTHFTARYWWVWIRSVPSRSLMYEHWWELHLYMQHWIHWEWNRVQW